tara:strand:+ start:1314 stop:1694 length:381 start_codon:yes stop_codon:yes gene_type:complete
MSEERKYQLVETLLKLTKEWDTYIFTIKQSLAMLKIKFNDVSDEDFIKIQDEFGPAYFLDKVVNVYLSHLDEKDIEDLIAFYSSDLGKKMRRQEMLSEFNKMGVEWTRIVNLTCAEKSKLQYKREN